MIFPHELHKLYFTENLRHKAAEEQPVKPEKQVNFYLTLNEFFHILHQLHK